MFGVGLKQRDIEVQTEAQTSGMADQLGLGNLPQTLAVMCGNPPVFGELELQHAHVTTAEVSTNLHVLLAALPLFVRH